MKAMPIQAMRVKAIKTWTRLLLSAGLGATLLSSCLPAGVIVDYEDRRPGRAKVVPRRGPANAGFRIQANPAQIKLKRVPPGHLKQQGKHKAKGRGKRR